MTHGFKVGLHQGSVLLICSADGQTEGVSVVRAGGGEPAEVEVCSGEKKTESQEKEDRIRVDR